MRQNHEDYLDFLHEKDKSKNILDGLFKDVPEERKKFHNDMHKIQDKKNYKHLNSYQIDHMYDKMKKARIFAFKFRGRKKNQ